MTCLAFARFAGIVATLFLLPFEALGQNAPPATPARPSQPSAPHERMALFEGTWTMQPNPYFKGQPAGTPLGAGEETCAWLPEPSWVPMTRSASL